ncbi:MAG TPA: AAA family ATPase [Gemmataceae bacterium]|jgi:MoxR-like ATPase
MNENGAADRLRRHVVEPLKRRFVGRDEVIDLTALAVVAGEHLFLLGPPGTAKSALVREFATAVRGRYFEYLLTRFSEPNEVFGPIDLVRLREGTVATVTTGMLPEAEFVFLDELFNANSAILNNLLTVLNERVYRRGAETHRLPLVSLFAASNHLPEDEALQALFDRFLVRCKVEPLPRAALPSLLAAGWALEGGVNGFPSPPGPLSHKGRGGEDSRGGFPPPSPLMGEGGRGGEGKPDKPDNAPSAADLRDLAARCRAVDLGGVAAAYADAVTKVRDLGVALTDRRAVKVLKLVAASAVLCGRAAVDASDLWVLRYVWDREEQIAPLTALVAGLLEQAPAAAAHPLAARPERADGDALARQLDDLDKALAGGPLTLVELARLRDQVAGVSDRAAWVADAAGRDHLLARAGELLERIG